MAAPDDPAGKVRFVLVLLSFALVLAATVLLVLGLLNDDGLMLIYLSIASSVAAAVVLLAALRMNKPRTAEGQRTAPEPLPMSEPDTEPTAIATAPAAAVAEPVAAPAASDEWLASEQDAWPEDDAWADEPAAVASVDDELDVEDELVEAGALDTDVLEDEGEEVEFPIADYDTLTVGQILPLLPQLYEDEYEVVEERERLGKARPQVLAKLAELRAGATATAAVDPLASYTEPAAEPFGDDEWFPIEDYESLSAAQIRPLLAELDAEELELVRSRELSLGRRRSLLDDIDRLTASAPPIAVPEPAPAPVAKAPAAKRAPAKKAAAPAKKATKAAVTKSAASKAGPAKKAAAPAKKATAAKKAPATTASTRAVAATAKATVARAAVTKSATAKKAAPAAKKATKAATKATKATRAPKAVPPPADPEA